MSIIILLGDILVSLFTLYLGVLSVRNSFTGSLPYVTALIGMYQASTAYVLGKYFDKAKAENTTGGITYDIAMKNEHYRDG